MTLGDLRSIIKEVLQELNEANVTNVGGASFTPGDGANMLLLMLLVKRVEIIEQLNI